MGDEVLERHPLGREVVVGDAVGFQELVRELMDGQLVELVEVERLRLEREVLVVKRLVREVVELEVLVRGRMGLGLLGRQGKGAEWTPPESRRPRNSAPQ